MFIKEYLVSTWSKWGNIKVNNKVLISAPVFVKQHEKKKSNRRVNENSTFKANYDNANKENQI